MNLPNKLLVFRIFLAPLFIYTYLMVDKWLALSVFILAGITDVLDGYIARKYDMITKLGTVIDPLADKLMLISVLSVFTYLDIIPIFILGIIILKECILIIGAIYIYLRKGNLVIPANKFGKAATVIFYLAIIIISFNKNIRLNYILIGIATVFTVIALISYIKEYHNEHKKS
ncbi:MAG: CDP-diacylglycerol--glycerol-3-phosphate 3-phosphatidyltransferase [Bacillota bacterium]|nr:CDP-diacylglycerol--glycerol-3-phosphate 3-phosphatidyltransferase [Bacillota bacterium]